MPRDLIQGEITRRIARFVAIAVVAGVAALGLSSPATAAGAADCTRGYACVWWDLSYSGGWQASSLDVLNIARPNHNSTTSVKANGGNCTETRFYDLWISGTTPTGPYFTLYSQTLIKSNYQDTDLRNGAGLNGAGIPWDDRVSSFKFYGC